MDLNLQVIREMLEKRFAVEAPRSAHECVFSNVRCFFGQAELMRRTLYVLDVARLGEFCARPGADEACAVVCGDAAPAPDGPACLFVCDASASLVPEVLTLLQSGLDRIHEWDLRLASLCGRGKPLRELLQLGYEMFRNPMLIYDRNYLICASTQGLHTVPDDPAWRSLIAAGYWTPELRSVVRTENRHFQANEAVYYETSSFERNAVIVPFAQHTHYAGTLFIMEYFEKITPGQMCLIQHFADLVREELLEWQRYGGETVSDTESFLCSVLFSDGSESYSDELIDQRLHDLGWRSRDRYCVLVFADIFHQRQYVLEHMRRCFPGCYCVEAENRLITLVRLENGGIVNTEPLAEVVRESVMKCGISDVLPNFLAISYGYRQAVAALTTGELLDPTFWYYHYADYCAEHMMALALQGGRPEIFCHGAVLTLDREDHETGTQYVETLQSFIAGGCNLKQVAESLHMHRNTLQYRLNRIAQLAGIDFKNDVEVKRIFLSIKLLRVWHAQHRQE